MSGVAQGVGGTRRISGRRILALLGLSLTILLDILFVGLNLDVFTLGGIALFLVPALATSVPLILDPRGVGFRVASLFSALTLIGLSLIAALVGGLIFLIPAGLMVLAGSVSSAWEPRLRSVVLSVGSPVLTLGLLGGILAIYETHLRPYDGYRVYLVADAPVGAPDELAEQVIDLAGVDHVTWSGPTSRYVDAFWEDNLTTEQRAELRARLLSFPEVSQVRPCRC
jgi:hypothetical protein